MIVDHEEEFSTSEYYFSYEEPSKNARDFPPPFELIQRERLCLKVTILFWKESRIRERSRKYLESV